MVVEVEMGGRARDIGRGMGSVAKAVAVAVVDALIGKWVEGESVRIAEILIVKAVMVA